MITKKFRVKHFIVITLLTSIWIHISEVFRYFVLVMPRVKLFFGNKQGVAAMDMGIFAIWGLWDTLLTGILVFVFYLYSSVFGTSNRSILISGTIVWLGVFVIFWIATANMGLSEWKILWITLPLSFLEMVVGTWIASTLYKTYKNDNI
jgi:hypothetical protein